jgi:hypothetical protein
MLRFDSDMRPEKMVQRGNVVLHSQNGKLWNIDRRPNDLATACWPPGSIPLPLFSVPSVISLRNSAGDPPSATPSWSVNRAPITKRRARQHAGFEWLCESSTRYLDGFTPLSTVCCVVDLWLRRNSELKS